MRYSAFVGCVIAAGLVASCSGGGDTSKVADEVKAAMDDAIAGFNAHDAARATAVDAPGFIGMFHGMNNTNGVAQDLALTQTMLNDPAAKIEADSSEINVAAAGDMAVWRASYAFTHTDAVTKAVATERGNWVMIFRRQPDGKLKATLGVVSDTAPAKAAAAPPTA